MSFMDISLMTRLPGMGGVAPLGSPIFLLHHPLFVASVLKAAS